MAMKGKFGVDLEVEAESLFIGDICYALDEKIYRSIWCDKMNCQDGVIKTNGDSGDFCAVVAGTAYGDGVYESFGGTEFPVDAGVIGIVNLKYRREKRNDAVLNKLGKVVEVPSGKAKIFFSDIEGFFELEIYDLESHDMIYATKIQTGEEAKGYLDDYSEDDEDDYEDDYEEDEN